MNIDDFFPERPGKRKTQNIFSGLKDNNFEAIDFIAIDFETATVKEKFPCEIGITVVKNQEIVNSFSMLIQPPHNRYEQICSEVHHISPEQTKTAPLFPEVWEKIKELFEGSFIVAHNAAFDISVLSGVIQYYNLEKPNIKGYACTCDLFHKLKLNEACSLYNIELENHHDGECDSKACAQLYLNYIKRIKPTCSIEEILESKKSETQKTNKFLEITATYSSHSKITGDLLKKDLSNADPNNPFYDKKVVITGVFSVDRSEIALKLKEMGADIDSGVTKKTSFIIVGNDPGPSKLKKVENYKSQGYNIQILNENQLNELIKLE